MGTVKFAKAPHWHQVLEKLAEGRTCYGPVDRDSGKTLEKCDPTEVSLEGARTVDPIKTILVPPRDEVARYGQGAEDAKPNAEPAVILGARQCDISGLRIQDYSFLEAAVEDPFYKARRENTLIVGADCTEPYESCFCTYYGTGPHVTKGADIAISKVDRGWCLEALSEKGEEVLKGIEIPEAPEDVLKEREKNREEIAARLSEKVEEKNLPSVKRIQELVCDDSKDAVWLKEADRCVECGACNLICCTCHCFLLVDGREGESCTRLKNWDSCLYENFATVAGGANPRKRRAERLRNRFSKKFDFFPTHLDELACYGCGRCIEACAGKIDIREVMRELADG